MIKISEHASYVQNVSEIMADLFDLVVTIVDRDFYRVSGTHHYKDSIGKQVKNHHVFSYVMEKDKSVIIDDPGNDMACIQCPNRGGCGKTAAIYTPLKVKDKIVGGLAIIAFNHDQEMHMFENKRFFHFIEKLSELISSKLEAEQSTAMFQDSLKKNIAILNAVHDGVIAINSNGIIEQINHSALAFFGINENQCVGKNINRLLSDSVINEILNNNAPILDKEIEIKVNNKKTSVYLTSQPVNRTAFSGGAVLSLKNAQEITSLARNISISGTQPISFDDIIGKAPALESVKDLASKVAIGDSSVLIRGESGTGKELFARAIHNESFRSNEPFIAVNCAAIPELLLESELFGYVEGAFTGARRGGKLGKCEMAIGGTLFLDEVGDIPLFLQSKFLRMLQEKTIERVGGTKTIPVDIRIIAATNRDLESMIKKQEFREDLYYRLNVIPVFLPPLRERREDIYDLCMHFLRKYSIRLNKKIKDIALETLNLLENYSWPGNIRELENSIEYAINVETTEVITPRALPARISSNPLNIESIPLHFEGSKNIIRNVEINELSNALNKFGWDTTGKQAAAEYLGISLATLYRRLKKLKEQRGFAVT